MADDKKPKIDLKARLGKATQGASVPVPTAVPSGMPSGMPSPGAQTPPPPAAYGSAPPPMPGVPLAPPPKFGVSQPAPAIDPSNPLAAVASYRPQISQAAPATQMAVAAPARIEVDEVAIQEARKGANKRGMIIAVLFAFIGVGVGFVAGGASEQGKAREKSKGDAASLAEDVTKAKDTLTKLADKMDEGVKTLGSNKFPDKLASDLGGLNVAFDGSELAGRRFSGFPQDTTAMLVDFITSVQALNDRKELIQGLLTKLQKPMTEQLNAPAGSGSISLIAAVQKDSTGNPYAFLAPLSAPITFTSSSDIKWPSQFTFSDPMGGGGANASAPRYTGGDISKAAAAIPVVGKTFEKVCPSEAAGGVAQLKAQIGGFIRDIKGEGPAQQDVVTDTKPGLLERADKLIAGLQKVQ